MENRQNNTSINEEAPPKKMQFEMITNPKFDGDQSYTNLSSLKQSIHFLLNAGEISADLDEQPEDQSISKFEQTQIKLKKTLQELQKPSFSIFFGEDSQINTCAYNPRHKAMILGDSVGKIIFLAMDPDLRGNSESNKTRTCFLNYAVEEVAEDCQVLKVEMDGNRLVVVTDKAVFSYFMNRWNSVTRKKMIFEFAHIKELEAYSIKEIIIRLDLQMVYYIMHPNQNKKIRIFKVSLKSENEFKIFEVGIDAHGFKVSHKSEDIFYFLRENVVFKQDFKEQKKGVFDNLLTGGFGMFGGEKKVETDEEDLFGAEEFFKAKHPLNFIKFDSNMQHFFCNDKKSIRRYRSDNKEVVNVYDDAAIQTNQVFFSEDQTLMFSLDNTQKPKIWSLATETLISTLQPHKPNTTYQKVEPIMSNKLMIGVSEEGLDVWQMEVIDNDKALKESDSSPMMIISEETQDLVMVFDKKKVYVIDIESFTIRKKIHLPKNTVDIEMLANGDLNLIVKNGEFNETAHHLQEKIKEKMNNKLKEIAESKMKLSDIDLKGNRVINGGSQRTQVSDTKVQNNYETIEDAAPDEPIFEESSREVIQVNQTKPFKYMNLSTKQPKETPKVNYIDDSNVEKLMSKTEFQSNKEILGDDEPLTSQPTLFRRKNGNLEMEIIDPSKYRYFIKKLVLDEFDKDYPDKCLYTIYQSVEKIVSIQTSKGNIKDVDNLNQSSRSSRSLKSSRTSFRSFDKVSGDNDEEIIKISKEMYETAVFLDGRKVNTIKYWTGVNSAPITEKIVIEETLDVNKNEETSKNNVQTLALNDSSKNMNMSLQMSMGFSQKTNSLMGGSRSFFKLYGVQSDVKTGWIFSSYYEEGEVDKTQQIVLIAKDKRAHTYKMLVDVKGRQEFTRNENYNFRLLKTPKSRSGQFGFLLESPANLMTFNFSLLNKSYNFFKFFAKENNSEFPALFSKKRSLFYLIEKNVIKIYDDRLEYFLDQIEMTKSIEEAILNDKNDTLMIYDLYFYYEIGLNDLQIRRQVMATNQTKDYFFCPLNFRALPRGQPWKGVFYYNGYKILRLVTCRERLELKKFPFQNLLRCFDGKNHAPAIRQFSEYYFAQLDKTNRMDDEYGPINPLFMCIFNENSPLLQEILAKYYYPSRIFNYPSPLEYAFVQNHKASINELCNALLKRDETIHFTKADFKYLLASEQKICHKVASTIIADPGIAAIPRLIYIDQDVAAKSCDYLLSMAVILQRHDDLMEQEFLKKAPKKKSKVGVSKYYAKSADTLAKNDVSIGATPFKYNYNVGTDDSVMFIDRFSNSKSEDFVLSDWKELVNIKWRQFKIPYIFLSLVFYTYLVFTTLSLAFLKTSEMTKWISIGLSIFFVVYEIFKLLTFMSYKPIIYFSKAYTYVDWVSHVGTLIYLFYLHQDFTTVQNRIVGVFVLILVFYRGLGMLRIFDAFTTLVGIINTIIKELVVFFSILFYAYLCVVIVMIKLDNSNNITLRFQDVYYWVLLGGIEGDAFEVEFSAIPIVFGTLFITIVLLNILIAYLSNLFSRLEDQQKVSALKERASLILDFELVVRMFKYVIPGTLRIERKFEELKIQEMITSKPVKFSEHFNPKEWKKLQDYLESDKHLFVLKQTANEKEQEEEENVYQKIKNLEKANEDLTSLILLKNRVVEKRIEQLTTIMRKSVNNQNKTIDELRELIGNNFKGLQENTDNLIVSVDENDKRYMEKLNEVEAIKNLIFLNSQEVKDVSIRLQEDLNKRKR